MTCTTFYSLLVPPEKWLGGLGGGGGARGGARGGLGGLGDGALGGLGDGARGGDGALGGLGDGACGGACGGVLGGLGLKVPFHHLIPLNSIVGLVHSTQSGPTEDDGCSGHKDEGFDLAVLFVAALVVSVVSSSVGQSAGEDAVNLDAIGGVGVEVGIHSHDVRRMMGWR